MDVIKQIEREREAISYGIFGIHVVENVGPEADLARLLPTKIAHEHVELHDVQTVGQYLLPYRIKMNRKMGRVSINRLSGMLVGTVRELLREDDSMHWRGNLAEHSEIKFLKWVRNGIFHGNRFSFSHDTPDNAKWRGWEITTNMEGERVFTELHDVSVPSREEVAIEEERHFQPELKEGFMESGDAFALIDDVVETAKEELR